ncbi:thiamine-phosphate kinase [Methanobacterium aggregans]|uniref:thiamine-phosphate kinase n=1 Tax=Methanobacterium aggregans TaxID=1615586 RepID=UPI00315A70B1|nr:thiamine-monophosphate kinase [Methanobacterium aggregans]
MIKRLLDRSQKFQSHSLFLNTLLDENSFKSRTDDAALIDLGESYLVATSDMLMQSSHFPQNMSPRHIGKKVVTVNVSDIAAMGADTIGMIVSMGLPSSMSVGYFDQIIEGILEACKDYSMVLIGGDTNESSELTLCGTCIGIVAKKNVLMKYGARPGDIVAVTGQLGLAAAGFEILIHELEGSDETPFNEDFEECFGERVNSKDNFKVNALKHALEPHARLEEGVLLGKTGSVSSATDITDGLLSELGEIMDTNPGIGIELRQTKIPLDPEMFKLADALDKDPFELALTYGEDFELLLTIKKEKFHDLKTAVNESFEGEVTIHEIGRVDSSGRISMIDKDGKTKILTPRGYQHLN